ncbi:winged helix DNA-binding domain-containing protein [Solirubrobacter sp. CPCC 204708]|uniref:Winged helix DNA-binding domain-containing protein n=1 Tax=Solirubrobacter deserti TaxID=2282478 RepID=A0ABT4RK70_9ACTN|nr:crosslink repair DNA glycosylase YcaQ family protein [Solirubrobacter deserti]MBE2316866.1 winged helix DNA-binding domain-containing protein [Solirubrobacter deserti]MDA0138917.1 winged helix DNA-binding domain-containing protein [Solirubrobacter deserti]
MKWESVLAWRMARQHLTAHATDPLAVVSDLCGLHAQVLSSAQLTLWARMDDPPDVHELLWRDRTLVKTWAQRGTLHLHRTDELPLWVGAQAALKPRYETRSWLKHFKLGEDDVKAIIEGVPAALREGPKSREELATLHPGLARGYGDLLKPVAFRGELIYAEDGRFTLPEPFEPMDPKAATKDVARRFLTRYGPATREELAKWFGHPSPAQAGKWFPDDVVETEFGLALEEDVAAIEAAAPAGYVRLLPAFDQYVVAAPRDKRATAHPERIYRPGGWFSPVLLVDGVMAGVWTLEDGVVSIEPFGKLAKAVREAAEAEAARLPECKAVNWG